MRIIPAIDIIEGKCVRLAQGDYGRKTSYNGSPLEIAKSYEDAGVEYLHLVDLDGAKAARIINYKVLEELCNSTSLKIDFGGGVKSNEDIRVAFESGANQITAGSIAVKSPQIVQEWINKYDSEKIILGADSKDGKIATHGWLEMSDDTVNEFIAQWITKGLRYCIATDIEKDGMMSGPSLDLYKQLIQQNGELKLIASGGVSSIADIEQLASIGCEGAIVGKALLDGTIALAELRNLIEEYA